MALQCYCIIVRLLTVETTEYIHFPLLLHCSITPLSPIADWPYYQGNKQGTRSGLNRPAQKMLNCKKCSATIGIEDPMTNGWRILKACVSLNIPENGCTTEDQWLWQCHSAEVIVAAQLLELIERESARRFVVHFGQKTGLMVILSFKHEDISD